MCMGGCCRYEMAKIRIVKFSEYRMYRGGSYFKPPWGIEMGKNSHLVSI